jgi:mRNA interferase HigB
VRVMSFKALRDFWENPKSPQNAEADLRVWYKVVEAVTWRNFAALRGDFPSTDKVGHCFVFDVGNNRIRLIAYVFFADDARSGIVYVKKVMTHTEYDENKWPDECGCHKPPKSKTKSLRPVKVKKPKRRK